MKMQDSAAEADRGNLTPVLRSSPLRQRRGALRSKGVRFFRQIDKLLHELYGLTEEKIRIVKGKITSYF